MTTPEAVFAELQAKAPSQPGRAYRSFDGPIGLQVRAFVDGTSRLPGIGIRVPKASVPAGLQFPRIRGADLGVMPQESGGGPAAVTYELVANGQAYAAVFIELAARLITDATSAGTVEAALLRIARRMAGWARFFDARGAEGLGRSAQLGLIGELLCLRRLGALLSLQDAVGAWTGPTGTPHDFQNARGAIEAKLTTSGSPERVRITSERQLDDSAVPWLALFVAKGQEVAAGAVGLPGLVDQLRAAVSAEAPAASQLLEDRLLESGYSDADRARYEVRLTVHAEEFLHVTGEFPRIRPSELRSGVFAVAYDVPWSAIAPYRLTEPQLRRALGEPGQ